MSVVYVVTTLAVATAVATLAALPTDRARRNSSRSVAVAGGNLIAVLVTLAVIAVAGLGRGWVGALAVAVGLVAGNVIAGRIADQAWGTAPSR
jgi:Na+/melibiose symporter-like transporter